ncbi:MAG TPA: NAD-dependent epimerase/dehydratase family protein [Gemmatimonadaceae bacterium]
MTTAERSAPRTVEELEDRLSEPTDATIAALRDSPGDVIVLGAGGKMGPTLARMVERAARIADGSIRRTVYAVSRFSSDPAKLALGYAGVKTIRCNLLDLDAVEKLPDAPNVIFMAGQKFGTNDSPARTWMLNGAVPAICAQRYKASRIVAFSTGNVYPLLPTASGGATESTPLKPVGDYAASCEIRERVFALAARAWGTRVAIMRLNYAIDLRYGVLTDIALKVHRDEPVDVTMGHVNVVWQRDANSAAIELLPLAASPPMVMNVSGGETLSVRSLAEQLARRLGKSPRFTGSEAPDALLTNTTRWRSTLDPNVTSTESLLDWVAEWIRDGRPLLGKPTHFETRTGAF